MVALQFAGTSSPLVLASLTTALLLGLWLSLPSALLVMGVLDMGYLGAWIREGGALDLRGLGEMSLVPVVLLSLVATGFLVRTAAEQMATAVRAHYEAMSRAAETEARASLARHVHDSMAKSLQGLALGAGALQVWIHRDPDRAAQEAGKMHAAATKAVHEVRAVMATMRSPEQELCLATVIRATVDAWCLAQNRRCDIEVEGPFGQVSVEARSELVACLDEALENVARHAPQAAVSVRARSVGSGVELAVVDEGPGADPDAPQRAVASGHFGLVGMRERVATVGGSFRWRSVAGEGTTVEIRVPYRVGTS